MIPCEIKEKYLNHPLVNGNLHVLWKFGDFKMAASATGRKNGDVFIFKSPRGYQFGEKMAAELGLDFPVNISEEEMETVTKLMIDDNLINQVYVTEYGSELSYLNPSLEYDKELISENLEAIRKFNDLEDKLDRNEITLDVFNHLTSPEAKEKICVVDFAYGRSHYGSDMSNVFFSIYTWGEVAIDPRLVKPNNEHLVEAMQQLLTKEQLAEIEKRAIEIKVKALSYK